MNRTWKRSATRGALLSLVLSMYLAAAAQDDQPPHPPPPTISTPHQIAVTGCLRRAERPGTYAITGEAGTTWLLTANSPDLDLSRQVMHVVTVTGKEAPADSGRNQGDSGNSPRTLRVLTLETVSPSCTR
jgi:hypothetical protein